MVLEELVVVRWINKLMATRDECTHYTPLFVTGLLTHRISFQGSREGSESGEGILADEIDKLQVVTIGLSYIA